MAKRRKRKGKTSAGSWVLLVVLVLMFGICRNLGGSSSPSRNESRPTNNNTSNVISSSTPRPTNTPRPSRTPTAISSPTNQPIATNTVTITFYAAGVASVRPCPEISDACSPVSSLSAGDEIHAIGQEEGDEFRGSTIWYQFLLNGEIVYVHSALVSRQAPVAAESVNPTRVPSTSVPVATVGSTTRRPGNCATAVAMGLTAEQAAQWPHLDRDKDGVACYGD